MTKRFTLAAAFTALTASPAFAHLDPAAHGSFAAGFTHPIFGLDHVLAMIAVGLWAALIGGRSVWLLPSTFVGAMLIGFAVSMAGLPLPYVEPTILASVVVLGLVVALALRLPTWLSVVLITLFGTCHGHAHGGEMGSAGLFGYAAGFVLATAILHAAGVLIGYGAHVAAGRQTSASRTIIRALGAVTAAGGVLLAVS
ncbi:HupE/UreJ family protein [Labrenzia sp. PHM005]|uniref:HupE/UreJ family protein n=1 Tax=Labrenzia sp. PHM005 TaxID=2590016 RepID=UPI00114037A6|nr:HupE/UreJ family protein [Labrenzia sp. PHM005]QDG79037.1 HupE/UreJ family protein [Labrenzia sp. PHM005]